MMKSNDPLRECPKCGAPVPADAPQGLCPKCVLAGAATPADARLPAAATADIPSLERVAASFPQLEILELIGRGGMGFVFKARQPHLDRLVALKLLPDKLARDPQFAERFNREGRVLARLSHPNIVSIFDFGQAGEFYFLLMEYVDGVNLRQAMQAGRFSPAEALTIVPKICEALQYAHEQGVLHRDIKPENILLDGRGRVKIADFGIAKLVGEDQAHVTLTNTGSTLGTPHYMAPEQLEKPSEVDHRADIYSLGVVFYEMLTGELPMGRFAPPSKKTPVDARVDEVVFRALERERENRFQTIGEVKTRVDDIRTSAPPASDPASASASPASSSPTPPRHGPQGTLVLESRYSKLSIWSAVLTGLSLILLGGPLLLLMVVGGGLGVIELLILGLPGCGSGLAGTIMGWMALSDLRAHRPRLRGTPLAVFAALTWPLLFLVILVSIPAYLLLRTTTPGARGLNILALIPMIALPAGVLTFVLWAVYAAVRWVAGGTHSGQRRGVLRWVFLVLLMSGLIFVLMRPLSYLLARIPHSPRAIPGERVGHRPPPPPQPPQFGRAPIDAGFEVPPGLVATFVICRVQDGRDVPVPSQAGYVMASDTKAATGRLVLKPDRSRADANPEQDRWSFEIASDEGTTLGIGTEALGPLILPPGHKKPLMLSQSSAETNRFRVVLAYAAGKDRGFDPSRGPESDQSALSVLAVFEPRPRNLSAPAQVLLGGGTNWLEGAAMSEALGALQTSKQPATIFRDHRFTVINVGLEEEEDGRWLTTDIMSNVSPDWETDFHVLLEHAPADTRVQSLQSTASGSTSFRQERLACRLPDSLSGGEAQALRDELSQSLVAQTMAVSPGKDLTLFSLPIAELGILTGTVSLRSPQGAPSVRLMFTAVELIKEKDKARLSLEYAQEDHGAELSFQTSGLIPGATVDLLGSTKVQDQGPNRAAYIRHQISLALPARLTEDEALRLRQATADKWLGASLVVHPGDQHTLFTVPVPDGDKVAVLVVGKEASSPP